MDKHQKNIAALLSNQTARRLSREERRRKARRRRIILTYLCFMALLLFRLIVPVTADTANQEPPPESTETAFADGRLPGDDIPATEICYIAPEEAENELIEAALLESANRIDDCTVTWYTNDTCNKKPGDPAYGITASGLPTVGGLTCAVDKRVIPLYSDVFVQFADGTIKQYWATDTGVKGNAVDIFEPDYDTCINNGRQSLTVWWCES